MPYHSITNINLFSRYIFPVYVLLHIFKYKEKNTLALITITGYYKIQEVTLCGLFKKKAAMNP